MTEVARPPGPKLSTLGAVRAFRRDRLGLLMRAAREFGDVVFLRMGRFDVYLLMHPDHIRDVLVSGHHDFMKGQTMQEAKRILGESLLTSEGESHRRQRRLIQPIFHHDRIAGYGDTMVEHGLRTMERWVDGRELDVHTEMSRLTLSIVGRTLFDTDVEAADARAIGRALSDVLSMFDRIFSPFGGLLDRLPLPSNRRSRRAQEVLDATIYRMIADRRAAGATGEDLLSLLLGAEDAGEIGARMTDQQVRDEAITLFLAGHETTSNALTWTWYFLSQHPVVEAKLHAELDEVLGGRPPSVSDIPRLQYTEMVLSESMRLFPPAWAIGRRVLVDHEVAGYVVPADSIVVISQYVTHRDPRWYADPLAFRPERWTSEERAARPRYSYFPFGGGPRMCIGEPFAWMELMLLVPTIAQRWRLRMTPGHAIELQPVITLRPKHGVRMTPERTG